MADQKRDCWLILMVDDDEEDYLIARAILSRLEGRHVQLDWAPAYEAGQAALQAKRYDAVLVDYDLGPRTGLDLIRETAGQEYPAPLILYTGRGSYAVDVEAMQAGATMYLTKAEATPLLMERFLRYAIEQKRTEEQLRQAEHKYRTLAENSPDIIYIIDLASRKTVYINSDTLLGYTLEELEAPGSILAQVHPDDLPLLQAYWQQVMAGNVSGTIEYRLRHKDGSWVWLNSRQSILTRDAQGRPVQLMVTLRRVGDRKQAEAALRQSEKKYRVVVDTLKTGIILHNTDGTIITCNRAAEEILGLTADQLLGRSSVDPRWQAVHPDGSPFPGEAHPSMVTLRTGKSQENVVMGVHKPDGSLTWITIDSYAVCIGEGDDCPDAVLTSFTDITGRKQAEDALKKQ